MKKSNIYLISILSSFTLFILLGAVVSVVRGKSKDLENKYIIQSPHYSHIDMQNVNYKVGLVTSDNFEFELILKNGIEKINLPFDIKGNTLVLSKIPSELEQKIKYVTLKLPEKNLAVKMISSSLDFDSYLGDSLKLDLDLSRVNISTTADKKLSHLEVDGRNNSIFYSFSEFENLQLNIKNSEFKALGTSHNISGKVTDDAYILIHNPGNTNLNKDASSTVEYRYN